MTKPYSRMNKKERRLAIMQNIIDHDGEFKPEVLYTVEWDK